MAENHEQQSVQMKIREAMKEAMKAKEEPRLTVLRGLLSAFTEELTRTKRTPQEPLPDEDALAVIRRSLKQRHDAAEQFKSGGRNDLAQKELSEAAILEVYLPKMMSRDEIRPLVEQKRAELGVHGTCGSMGNLIGEVMRELKGKADGKDVKAVVEAVLNDKTC